MEKGSRLKGLNDSQVLKSREAHGANLLTPPEREPWWKDFLLRFSGPFGKMISKNGKSGDPLIFILEIAGVLSVAISCYEYYGLHQGWKVFFEPIGIFMAIFLATGLAEIFESKANRAFRILNQVNDDEPVDVVRNATTTTIPRRDVVVGDIVILNTGDEIAADGTLLDAVTLSVDESTLTGEPVTSKSVDPESDKHSTYPANRVFRGTKVMEGHGVMEVTAVGDATQMGNVFREAQIDNSVRTPLDEQLAKLSDWITDGSYIVAAIIIAAQLILFLGAGNIASYMLIVPVALFFYAVIARFRNWSLKKCAMTIGVFFVVFFGVVLGAFAIINPDPTNEQWSLLAAHTLETLMVAVTLIVVAVPEGLPMAVTLSLAYSMRRMFKTNNLVRRMHACETMGASTVICTDKTGTLTQNRMQVAEFAPAPGADPALVNEGIAVNSTASLDFSTATPTPVGNPTEGALLLWLNAKGVDYRTIKESVKRLEELPFTTERKYMATVVESPVSGKPILYVKGAPEIVLAITDADAAVRQDFERKLLEYQDKAMRTIAIAYLPLEAGQPAIDGGRLTEGLKLHLLGVFAISDPIRDDVPEAVGECQRAGIDVKIVTGDTPATAREIGRRIGLWNDSEEVGTGMITGPEFDALDDKQIDAIARSLKVISRARPTDKRRLVEALQRAGEVVAVTGDGTNDAPALRQAHVGLSMGDGTSVAKEASDITIIDNSFASIGRAVMWGRSLYKNIQRFLLFQLTVNVAACLLVLVGSFIGQESPLTVTQMLWVNLIMDTFGAMALASLPPTRRVMNEKPRDRRQSIINRAMGGEIVGVGVFFFLLTIVMYWRFNNAVVTSLSGIFTAPYTPGETMSTYEATLLFSVFVWTHFWYMFDARAFQTDESIFRMSFSQGFWTIVAIIVVGQLFITEIAYEFFNVEPMLHTLSWQFNPEGSLDLVVIIAASSLVLWVREIYRSFVSR